MSSITVYDIANDIKARNIAFKHYLSFRDIYLDKNHKLYDELWDNLARYPMFLISYENDIPRGMGGVNDFYWKQTGVARVMDRAFNFQRTMTSFGSTSKYILQPQINFCLENGIHTMFMSVEEERRIKVFQKHWLDKHFPQFKLQPYRYNVCPQTEYINCDDSCWQSITVYHATENRDFVLPHKKR